MEEKISTGVLDIDRRIRFAVEVTNRGEVIEGGFQQKHYWSRNFTLTHCQR
jgi:hypothetical protein